MLAGSPSCVISIPKDSLRIFEIEITCLLMAQLVEKCFVLNNWQVTAPLHSESHNDSDIHQMVAVP